MIDDPDNQAVDLRNGISTEANGDTFTVRFLNYQPLSGVNNFNIVGCKLSSGWSLAGNLGCSAICSGTGTYPCSPNLFELLKPGSRLKTCRQPNYLQELDGHLLVEHHIGQLMPQMELWTLDGSLEKTLAYRRLEFVISGWKMGCIYYQ